MKARRRPVSAGLRVHAYAVMERAVDDGLLRGWTRAHKHTNKPAPGLILNELRAAILVEICAVFAFEEGEGRP